MSNVMYRSLTDESVLPSIVCMVSPKPRLLLWRRARKFKFALKIIDKASCRGKEQQIENEVSILRRLRHGNIVQLIEDFDTPDRLYMVMELVTVRHMSSVFVVCHCYVRRLC